MTQLSYIRTVGMPDDATRSQITDLAVWVVDGATRLYATTRYDGQISSWNINGLIPKPLAEVDFDGGLAPGRTGGLTQINVQGSPVLLTGGAANGGLRLHDLDAAGGIGTGSTLAGTTGILGGLQGTVTVDLYNGQQAIYGGLAGRDGLGQLTFNSAGNLTATRSWADTSATYAGAVSAVAHIRAGGQDYIYTASATEHGISTWIVSETGGLTAGPALGMNEGLWIAAPTALATAKVDGRDYLIVGSAVSNSLSVIEVRADGALAVRDHLLDTRDSRFGGVQAVEVVTVDNQTYVISGGADDGISVHVLIPGGQLVAIDVMADTQNTAMQNVSAIATRITQGNIDIFVASASENGITKLQFDTGPAGATLRADNSGETLTGTAGRDILIGGNGNDRISGSGGNDIIRDGTGSDTLTGGAGADIFIMAYDNSPDVITDFTPGEDRIDLSGWPMVRSVGQLTLTSTATGLQITYGDEVLEVRSNDGAPIDHRLMTDADLIGGARLPDVILPGFAGPYTPAPRLPDPDEFLGITSRGDGSFTRPSIRIDGQRFSNPDLDRFNGRLFNGNPRGEKIVTGKKNDKLMGEGGHDRIFAGRGTDRVFGGNGNDRLYGGKGSDLLSGNRGNDKAYGDGGDDWLIGDSGKDRLYGGHGDDLILGGTQSDRLFGGSRNDRLYGGSGNNKAYGQSGHDRLTGLGGRDRLEGGSGKDVLIGGGGSDRLLGGTGQDRLFGGSGNDVLLGNGSADRLFGGRQNDRLYGGSGGDEMSGGAGNDRLYGGSGADYLKGQGGNDRISGGSGHDLILGGSGDDVIYGSTGDDKISGGSGNDLLSGGLNNDDLRGGTGDDRLWGNDGDDTLAGDAGQDSLSGGNGNDTLTGGEGDDLLKGDAGNDNLSGEAGDDLLEGGEGDDILAGGAGDDLLTGGVGVDTFIFDAGADHIVDFTQGQDLIVIGFDAFDGRLVASEVLLFYGTLTDTTVTLDFENGNVLVIDGVTDYATLVASLNVV